MTSQFDGLLVGPNITVLAPFIALVTIAQLVKLVKFPRILLSTVFVLNRSDCSHELFYTILCALYPFYEVLFSIIG